LSWYWLGLAMVVPTAAGFAIALPFWFARHATFGNVVGSGVMLLGALLSIGREFQALRALREAAVKTGHAWHPVPDEFTRYAIYAGIGFAEVFLLFTVSIWVDEAIRRRGRARAWR
jgi:hypothetical protein